MSGVIDDSANIILIGMPGVGKSTVGVLLAKALRRGFVDTDLLIQAGEDRGLQEIINRDGNEAFCRLEEQYLLCLDVRRHVIATGGSAVYSEPAMRALKASGPVVHLSLPLERLLERLENLATRGVVIDPNQGLGELYRHRMPLYARWADITVDCDGRNQDQLTTEIIERLQKLTG